MIPSLSVKQRGYPLAALGPAVLWAWCLVLPWTLSESSYEISPQDEVSASDSGGRYCLPTVARSKVFRSGVWGLSPFAHPPNVSHSEWWPGPPRGRDLRPRLFPPRVVLRI